MLIFLRKKNISDTPELMKYYQYALYLLVGLEGKYLAPEPGTWEQFNRNVPKRTDPLLAPLAACQQESRQLFQSLFANKRENLQP